MERVVPVTEQHPLKGVLEPAASIMILRMLVILQDTIHFSRCSVISALAITLRKTR